MALATPTRRALVDLPVNTFGTPSGTNFMGKIPTGHKRGIEDVEQPDLPPSSSRLRVSPSCSKPTLQEKTPPMEIPAAGQVGVLPPETTTAQIPELAEAMDDGASQNSFKDSTLSSLIDFDPDETMESQQTAATEMTQPIRSRVSQHAETLRLRLRLAQFKIRTSQTNIPFAQLRLSTSTHQASPPASRESTLQPDEQPSLPSLLPAPELRPTAYSARTITRLAVPSSPPSSPENSVGKAARDDDIFRTPALPRHKVLQQMSSPPDSLERRSQRGGEEESLTSSAVRGKAAIGLLGLRGELC